MLDPGLREKFWPPPAASSRNMRLHPPAPAEGWSTSGTPRQGKHHSPRSVNRGFWEGSGAHLETVAADEDWCGVVSAPHKRLKPNRTTTLTSGSLWHRNGPQVAFTSGGHRRAADEGQVWSGRTAKPSRRAHTRVRCSPRRHSSAHVHYASPCVPPLPLADARPCLSTRWALNRCF